MGNEVFSNVMLKQSEGMTICKGAEGGGKGRGREGRWENGQEEESRKEINHNPYLPSYTKVNSK